MAHQFLNTFLTEPVLGQQEASYGRSQRVPPTAASDELGAGEAEFIGQRDSFYIASVNPDGWPYIQHRGGPAGFLKVLDAHTLAFADFSGNRQLLTAGHVTANDRVALFLMDYPNRERLKIIGHAEVMAAQADPALAAALAPSGASARTVERVFKIRVTGFDWNCPKYITPRFTAEQVSAAVAPLHRRIAELETLLKSKS
jgi:predicted pyridoxine 5'-phosphate oxidase superfamily flavin-nucleotide-binding protein